MKKNKKIIVYRLLFSNNKSYIGVTNDLKKRLWDHNNRARLKVNLPISNAINLYPNYKVIILSSHNKKHKAYHSEMLNIVKYNTLTPNGYNITEGGPGVKGYTAERFKFKRTKTIKQIEASIKIAKTVLQKCRNEKKIAVKCSNGKTYECIADAAKELKIKNAGSITRVLKGKQIQTHGYSFVAVDPLRYVKDQKRNELKRIRSRKKLISRMKSYSKPVIRSDGKKYKSCVEASKDLGLLSPESVCAVLKGRSRTTKGYTFTYLNKSDTIKMGDKNVTGSNVEKRSSQASGRTEDGTGEIL